MLLYALAGNKMPVNGKQAKINPVPISEINAVCFDPAGHIFPCLKFRIIELKNAKNPAKT